MTDGLDLEPYKRVGSKGTLPTCLAPCLDVGDILECCNVCASIMGESKGHFTYKPRAHDHVIVRALDSHPKAVPLTWFVRTFVRPAYWRSALTQIPTDHETLFIVYHTRIRVDFSSMIISLDP